MSRADRVAGRLDDIDALLVTEPANLRYVTGFTGSNGFAVVGPDVRRFVTDFRYVEQAKAEVPDFDREQGPQELLGALSGLDGVTRLGFDDAHMSVRTHRRLGELLPDGVELVPAAGIVEDVRAVKEPGEVAAHRRRRRAGRRDLRLAAGVRARRAHGARGRGRARARDAPARRLRPVVRLDRRLGRARRAAARDSRATWRSRRDTLVTIDIGAVLDGYCSDCTRTWATGPVSDELAEVYALVLRAQVTALDAVRPGPSGRELDAVARDMIDRRRPRRALRPRARARRRAWSRTRRRGWRARPRRALEPGNVVTVEPGVYVPGRRRRADRGPRGRHRERPRCPFADHERAPDGRLGSSPRRQLKSGGAGGRYRGAMVLRPRTRLQLRRAVVAAALGALFVPAVADAKKAKTPVITKVTPKTADVGTKLTITRQALPPRQGQEQRAVPARQGQGAVRQGRREHDQEAHGRGPEDAREVHARRRAARRRRRASACACSRPSSARRTRRRSSRR